MSTSTASGASTTADAPDPDPRPKRRLPLWGLAAATVLALLVGVSIGSLVSRPQHPGDASPEAGFLRDMSTHHAQAVEMSMIAHAGSTTPDVVTLSGDIALTQHGQIQVMQAWLKEWGLQPTGTQAPMAWMPDAAGSVRNGLMPGMATAAQLTALRTATGKQLDVQFLELMRQHHLGGVHMAQEIVKSSKDEDVTTFAQTMATNQQSELHLLSDMLTTIKARP